MKEMIRERIAWLLKLSFIQIMENSINKIGKHTTFLSMLKTCAKLSIIYAQLISPIYLLHVCHIESGQLVSKKKESNFHFIYNRNLEMASKAILKAQEKVWIWSSKYARSKRFIYRNIWVASVMFAICITCKIRARTVYNITGLE